MLFSKHRVVFTTKIFNEFSFSYSICSAFHIMNVCHKVGSMPQLAAVNTSQQQVSKAMLTCRQNHQIGSLIAAAKATWHYMVSLSIAIRDWTGLCLGDKAVVDFGVVHGTPYCGEIESRRASCSNITTGLAGLFAPSICINAIKRAIMP